MYTYIYVRSLTCVYAYIQGISRALVVSYAKKHHIKSLKHNGLEKIHVKKVHIYICTQVYTYIRAHIYCIIYNIHTESEGCA